jgi:transposase-like protein
MVSESKFQELLNRYQESRLDIKSFCSNEGIAESTFYYWRKKLQRKESAKGFIPLVVKPARTSLSRQQNNTLPQTNPGDEQRQTVVLILIFTNFNRLRFWLGVIKYRHSAKP